MRSKKFDNMGEIKSVKVDNWGVFFLQKLQNFFNKTDYCDLTLQFNDNSQLKVHRLVLNACTDYFNVLEQTCEMIDDVLIMPNELQADLVVPIVNFMYTGTLEFELKIYGKLLKTARDMNMTVLLKLLEAHRKTMETKPKSQKMSPKSTGFASMKTPLPANNKPLPQKNVNRQANSESLYKSLQIKSFGTTNFKGGTMLKPQSKSVPVKGPIRFEYEGNETLTSFDSTFDNISYESKPLKVEYEEQYSQSVSSPFEQLRQTGYNNNKRPAQSILESPPEKKPNIQDVKEYAEQQRMRKQIAEEYGEEPDFESILDDEFHNDDDDEEFNSIQENTKPTTSKQSLVQYSSQKQQNALRKSNESSSQHKPTIVVKECSSSNVDHAKIISEVLRKYPHLIKNNKNIKLKIMPTTSGSGTQKVVIKKEPDDSNVSPTQIKSEPVSPGAISHTATTTLAKSETLLSTSNKEASTCMQKTVSSSTTPNQPRRIDSKTMKQLIALGAENTTGPWLCLRCGVNGRPISIPSYRGFRRHLVNTHKEKIDPRLCEHCGWRSINQKELAFHMYIQHDVRTSISFPKCEHCGTVVFDLQALDQHIDDVHPEVKEDNQQCIYCNKTFSTELMLYNHMKDQHKERARDDGVIDFSEEDEAYEEYEQKIQGTGINQSGSKIQILSDIDLPKCISLTQITKSEATTVFDTENLVEILGGNSQIMQPTDLITSIPGQISNEPKFINADGNVMELTPAQRAEIMSQLEQGGDGVVMVLDESFSERVNTKIEGGADEEISQDSQETTEQESEKDIAVMNNPEEEGGEHIDDQTMEGEEAIHESNEDKTNENSDLAEELEEQLNAWKSVESNQKNDNEDEDGLSNKEDAIETTESLDEQLEKLTQMTQPIMETKKQDKVSKDELDERLKMLTNDWSDDEEEGEEEEQTTNINKSQKNQTNGLESEVKPKSVSNEKENEKMEEEQDIEDILQSDIEDKKEKIQPNTENIKENIKENKDEKNTLSEMSQKDLDNTEESFSQHDSGDSNDEEDLLREQPICSTEEDVLVDNSNTVSTETLPKAPKNIEENKSIEEINEEDNIILKEKTDTSNIAEEIFKKDEEKIGEKIEEKVEEKVHHLNTLENESENEVIKKENLSETDDEKDIPQKREDKGSDDSSKKQSPDVKKDEIKSMINEWDEENDDDEL